MKIRYDSYEQYKRIKQLGDSPCVAFDQIEKSRAVLSDSANWHQDLELQLILDGNGYILINGERYEVTKNCIGVINSNAVHYTGSDSRLLYCPVIIDFNFCKKAGIDCSSVSFDPIIYNDTTVELFNRLLAIYHSDETFCKKAKLQAAVLNLLVNLVEQHLSKATAAVNDDEYFEKIKTAVRFIREHYSEKLTLDIIAKSAFTDKFTLSKRFKTLTDQTVIEYVNNFRCERVKDQIGNDVPIGKAALQCGFNNISFFTKTFKKYTGMLPSEYKKYVRNIK